MSIKIKPLRKFTTGTPSTSDMVEGELAVNTADKKVFMRDDSNNIVEVGAASSLSLPITGGTLTGDLTVSSTADNGPTLSLTSNDPSDVADFNTEGTIKFFAENDASQSVEYANIEMVTRDVSATSPDGRIEININEGGTVKRSFIFDHDHLYLTNAQPLRWLDFTSTHDYILKPTTISGDRTVDLPDASGTLALTSQLPSTALDDITAGDAAVNLTTTTGNITIDAQGSDTDIIFKGTDNTTDITALTLDMSEGGKAIFGGQASFGKELLVDMAHIGTYTKPAQFLVNDMGVGDRAQFTFGKALSASNLVEFGYYHAGDGSADNLVSIGFYGSGATARTVQRPDGKISFGSGDTGTAFFNEVVNVNGGIWLNGSIVFEGSSEDAFETTLAVTNPTGSDKTITLPNATGTVALTSQLPSTALDDITAGDAAVSLETTTGNITIDAQGNNTDIIFKGNNSGTPITAATFDMSNAGQLILSNGISSDGGMPISCTNGNIEIDCQSQDNDIVFKGNDGGSVITALTLDMSDAGTATFNHDVKLDGTISSNATINKYGSSSAPIVFTVTVATQTTAHPYYNDGSTNKYSIDGVEGAALTLHGVDTMTSNSEYYYRFDQSHSSNANHPLRFYYESNKTTLYTANVTTNGTPGQSGAYTQIAVNKDTPKTLYYQCQSHSFMGNYVTVPNSRNFGKNNTLKLETDSKIRFQHISNAHTTTLEFELPSSDHTITIPQGNTGTLIHTGNSDLPTTTTSSGDADFVLIDDGGTMKKITPTNLGIGGGGGATAADDITAGDAAVNLTTTSGNITIDAQGNDTDIIFKGTDNNNDVTFLTMEGSSSSTTFETTVVFDPAGGSSQFAAMINDNNAFFYRSVKIVNSNADLIFDKGTYETTLTTNNPASQNQTITLPDATGTVLTTGNSDTPTTTTSSGDADFVLIDDGGTMKKITPANLGIGGGGGGGTVTEAFKTIAVSGQSNVVADAAEDTLTLVAGSNMTITTNASGDSITFASSGGGGGGSTAADDITTGDAAVTIATSSGDITIDTQGTDNDIIFKGTDGGSDITALRLDMSAEGNAIFNHDVTVGATGAFRFADSHSSDAMTGIFVDTSSLQTNMIIQVGDDSDSSNSNEDQVRIRHRHYSTSPQDLDIAIFKRDPSNGAIGNTAFNGIVTVSGAFSATTKSFDIKHPTKEHMRLRYGVLEGPEHGVYVRGKLISSNVIELPEHWTGLVDEDTITVQLTPTGKFQKLYVKEINNNKITIGNSSFFSNNTECFYIVQGTRKDVDELEIEYEN